MGGKLILCENCPKSFHLRCSGLTLIPKGEWFCSYCICEICQSTSENTNLHTCSKCKRTLHEDCIKFDRKMCVECKEFQNMDAQAFLTWRAHQLSGSNEPLSIIIENEKPSSVSEWSKTDLLVKWKEKSYYKVNWVSYSWIKKKFPSILLHFCSNASAQQSIEESINPEWKIIERILNKEVNKQGSFYLVAWKETPLSNCTLESASWVEKNFLQQLSAYQKLIETSIEMKILPKQKFSSYNLHEFKEFDEQPDFIKGGTLHPYQLDGFNWLYYSWHKRRNGFFFYYQYNSFFNLLISLLKVILGDEMGLGKTIQW